MLKLSAMGVAFAANGRLRTDLPVGQPQMTGRETGPQPTGLKQSVCRWPFADIPDDRFFPMVKALGFGAVDLLTEKEWPAAERHGLICSMGTPTERRDFISYGLNDRSHHAILLPELERAIPAAKRHGVPNVIAMIGNRQGRSDADAIAACAEGLRKVAPLAEEQGVTICLELLNSRVDHKDFQGDRMSFGLGLMQAVDSPRVRLLYDIYHMQIMEGDIIRTIRDHGKWIAHYHTAGNPGRNELDPTQELNYSGIAKAIADSGFTGWIAHEFIPTRDPKEGLAAARKICA
ncbi:MAG TPA: TIM barrel protein [Gemmatimonadales bacterium]|nr:TIM barrel protein [Gemmatimonadales bacterium]